MLDIQDSRPAPLQDQADGLRRLFSGARTRFIAVAANPDVTFAGLALERLASVCAAAERKVLVVDAVSGTPHEMASVDLSACIEPLGDNLVYLAARGLPVRFANTRGSCDGFLDVVAEAACDVSVVVVHAWAHELGRLFSRRAPRPLLLAADHPASVTSAYANMKWLAQRHGLMAFDLLLVAVANSPRTPRIAEQLAITAERFCGAVLHDWAAIDPAAHGQWPPDLMRLALGQLAHGPLPALPARAAAAQVAW